MLYSQWDHKELGTTEQFSFLSIANDHKYNSFKQPNLLSHSFHGSVPWVRLAWPLLRPHQVETKVLPEVSVPFQAHWLFVEFSSLCCKTEICTFLQAPKAPAPTVATTCHPASARPAAEPLSLPSAGVESRIK